MKVFHEKFGEGDLINGMHAQPNEDGSIDWFDVFFEHGIERQVPSEDLFEISEEADDDGWHAHHEMHGKIGRKDWKAGWRYNPSKDKQFYHQPSKTWHSSIKNLAKEEVELSEKLTKDMSASDVIHDFVHSDDPKFKGKSKAERKKMALGAYYSMQKEGYEDSAEDEKEDKKMEKKYHMSHAEWEKSELDKKQDKKHEKKMKEEVEQVDESWYQVSLGQNIAKNAEKSVKSGEHSDIGSAINHFLDQKHPKDRATDAMRRGIKRAAHAHLGLLKKEEVEIDIEESVAPLWGTGVNKFRSFIDEEEAVKRGRGRPKGSKSFGASKRGDLTKDEAGAHSEPPTFTDQLLKAADSRTGGHVKFNDGKTHHIPKVHAITALHHLGSPEKPADKDKMRNHMSASKENFDAVRKSGGHVPAAKPAYDPDSAIKAKTKKIVGEAKELKGDQNKLDKNHNGHLDAEDFKLLRKGKKMTKEEYMAELESALEEGFISEEDLQELSKKTLGSYIHRAATNMATASSNYTKHDMKSRPQNTIAGKLSSGEEQEKYHEKMADKNLRTVTNRSTGIHRAVSKLAKEDVNMTKEESEPKTTVFTEANRYRAVESAVRDIMSQNRNVREEAKEAEWKRNNPGLYKKD
jgi:hypothetical protein